MFKKIGLSAAAIFAVVTLAQAPALAADRDDYGYRNSYAYGDRYDSRDQWNSRAYREREERRERERREHQRFERNWRGDGYRDYNRYWR